MLGSEECSLAEMRRYIKAMKKCLANNVNSLLQKMNYETMLWMHLPFRYSYAKKI